MSIEERLTIEPQDNGDLLCTIKGAPPVTITVSDFAQAGDNLEVLERTIVASALKAGCDTFQAGELAEYMAAFWEAT